jgi:O-antigen/teichoic acid export membrane protein
MSMSSLKEKSIIAFAWDISGRIGLQSVSFLVTILLARLLSPEDFGLLAIVNVVVAISGTFVDMGLGSALIQKKELEDYHYSSVFFFNIGMGLLIALALFFSSKLIATFYEREIIGVISKVMALIFIINSFGNVIRNKLQRELNFKTLTITNWFSAILSGIIGISMAFAGFGVWSLVAQAISAPLFANIMLFILEKWRPKLTLNFTAIKELWGFGFKMFLSGIIENVFSQLDYLIIGKAFNPAKLGYYYRARSLQNIIYSYSSNSLISVLFPALSQLQTANKEYKKVLLKIYHILSFISFFLVGFFFLIAKDFIFLLFSSKWLPSVELFQIMVIGGFIYPLTALLITVLSSKGNSNTYLRISILKRIIILPVYILIFFAGIKTFLYWYIILSGINLLVNMYYAGKEVNEEVSFFLLPILPYLFITAASTTIIYFLTSGLDLDIILDILIKVPLYSTMFLLLVWSFKLPGFILLKTELASVILIQK